MKSSSFKILDQNKNCLTLVEPNKSCVANLVQAFLLAATNVNPLGLTVIIIHSTSHRLGLLSVTNIARVETQWMSVPIASVFFWYSKDFMLVCDSCGIYFGVTCSEGIN